MLGRSRLLPGVPGAVIGAGRVLALDTGARFSSPDVASVLGRLTAAVLTPPGPIDAARFSFPRELWWE